MGRGRFLACFVRKVLLGHWDSFNHLSTANGLICATRFFPLHCKTFDWLLRMPSNWLRQKFPLLTKTSMKNAKYKGLPYQVCKFL